MKSIISIIFFSLILNKTLNAEIIVLKDCYKPQDTKFEKFEYKINTEEKSIKEIFIYTDEYALKKNTSKINLLNFYLKYYEKQYAKGYRRHVFKKEFRGETIIDINLNTQKIIRSSVDKDGKIENQLISCAI